MQQLPVCRPSIFSALQIFLLFVFVPALHPQAIATATKPMGASVFGAYSRVATDRSTVIGAAPTSNNAFTFGADLSGHLPYGFIPAVEGRIKIAQGSEVSENTYGGGLRLERRIRYLHPYIDFLVSYGTISFTHPQGLYQSDNSIVYSTGGGLDYNITPALAARFDYQYEFWKTGHNVSFTPNALTFGVVYRLPIHSNQSR